MACIFTVGEEFESFASLSEKIKQFELENYVQLWKRDARKIDIYRKFLIGKLVKYRRPLRSR